MYVVISAILWFSSQDILWWWSRLVNHAIFSANLFLNVSSLENVCLLYSYQCNVSWRYPKVYLLDQGYSPKLFWNQLKSYSADQKEIYITLFPAGFLFCFRCVYCVVVVVVVVVFGRFSLLFFGYSCFVLVGLNDL